MSGRSDLEGAAYRVIYGLVLVACFVIDISSFSELDIETMNGLGALIAIKTIVYGILGVVSHVFLMNLSSLHPVTIFGMLVMIIWLVILIFTFVIDKNKEQDVWSLLPLWLMPISGITLILCGLKAKVETNERQ